MDDGAEVFDPGKSDDGPSPRDARPARGRSLARKTLARDRAADLPAYGRRIAAAARRFSSVMLRLAFEGLELGRRFVFSLSGQLFIATAIFVAIVEVIIVVPRMAIEQESWLNDRVVRAEIASQALDTAQTKTVTQVMSAQLRKSAGVQYLAIINDGVPTYRLWDYATTVPDEVTDLRRAHKNIGRDIAYLWAPWRTLLEPSRRLIHVEAQPRIRRDDMIEIVVSARPLRDHLKDSLTNMVRTSLGISLAAGILVFAGLSFLVVRPIRRMTDAISTFKANPEDMSANHHPSRRADEIGQIERELVSMQEEVRNALRSRARLAALGQAVSKINHDLRNMLTSAQMASERLASSADPQVAKAMPRLERALGRAAALTRNVLDYGKSEEPAPVLIRIPLATAAASAAEDAGLDPAGVRLTKAIPARFAVVADSDQLHRILVNLMRNARQAIEADATRGARKGKGVIRITAETDGDTAVILIADDGPGIPPRLSERLFEAFVSGKASEGTGLGLTISRELAANHGGELRLVDTGPAGTTFEIRLPNLL